MTKMEFLIKKSRFSVKSRFKESKCADGGHSLNRDFTVLLKMIPVSLKISIQHMFVREGDAHRYDGGRFHLAE